MQFIWILNFDIYSISRVCELFLKNLNKDLVLNKKLIHSKVEVVFSESKPELCYKSVKKSKLSQIIVCHVLITPRKQNFIT
jgi:hypothetical protein